MVKSLFIKKKLQHRCFPKLFVKILRPSIATCAREPKALGSFPTVSYVQMCALCNNFRANVEMSVKQMELVERS